MSAADRWVDDLESIFDLPPARERKPGRASGKLLYIAAGALGVAAVLVGVDRYGPLLGSGSSRGSTGAGPAVVQPSPPVAAARPSVLARLPVSAVQDVASAARVPPARATVNAERNRTLALMAGRSGGSAGRRPPAAGGASPVDAMALVPVPKPMGAYDAGPVVATSIAPAAAPVVGPPPSDDRDARGSAPASPAEIPKRKTASDTEAIDALRSLRRQ